MDHPTTAHGHYPADPSGAVWAFGTSALATAATSVACDPATISPGDSTTCTATVKDTGGGVNSPTGSVFFKSDYFGGGALGNCVLVPRRFGTSSCAITYSPPVSGDSPVDVSYGGDLRYGPGSASTTVTVPPPGGHPGGGSGGLGGGSGGLGGGSASTAGGSPSQASTGGSARQDSLLRIRSIALTPRAHGARVALRMAGTISAAANGEQIRVTLREGGKTIRRRVRVHHGHWRLRLNRRNPGGAWTFTVSYGGDQVLQPASTSGTIA